MEGPLLHAPGMPPGLQNCFKVNDFFRSRYKLILLVMVMDFHFGEAQGGLGGLNLDEIDAANSFLRLPMARNGLEWPFKTS